MFIVLFEVYPHATQMQQYLDVAKLLRPELEQIDGFIDREPQLFCTLPPFHKRTRSPA